MNHTCLYSPAAERHYTFGWYSFPVPLRIGGWVGLGGLNLSKIWSKWTSTPYIYVRGHFVQKLFSVLDGCIVWNAYNAVFGSKRSLAVYFLHSTRPSVAWLNSRSSLAVCDWLMTLSGHAHLDSRRFRQLGSNAAENLGVSCTECTCQGNDFELIPTAKMETRHPVEGSFGNEFP